MMFKTEKRAQGRVLAQAATGVLVMILGGLTASQAYSIRVDAPPTLGTCSSVPIDSAAADFNPNVGISITSECNSTSGNDQAGGDPFETDDNAYSNLNLYNWGSSPSIQAQVAVYTLSSGDASSDTTPVSLGGLTEIEFDYAGAPTTCGVGDATLDWGTTYSATCAGTSSFSLLFSGTTLVGLLNDSNDFTSCDSSADCLTGTGWSLGTTTTVPEPGTLALFGLAALPVLLLLRRRLAITRN